MDMVLEIWTGPQAVRTFVVTAGQVGQVGRSGWADVSVPDDPTLADLHFLLECGPTQCRVRDLNTPGGTSLNGAKVSLAIVRDGDRIVAGRTAFVVHLVRTGSPPASVGPRSTAPPGEAAPSPAEIPALPATPADHLLRFLRGQDRPLFALLDAARDPQVLALMRGSGEEHQSLYEGEKGELLAEFAPYLVALPARSPLLETLVREGWGRSWGVYLVGDAPLIEIRRHLRHFLMVKLADGRDVYFRFYDPRVLRVFLPGTTPQEAEEFFGPIESYFMEAEDAGTLLAFSGNRRGVETRALPLSAEA